MFGRLWWTFTLLIGGGAGGYLPVVGREVEISPRCVCGAGVDEHVALTCLYPSLVQIGRMEVKEWVFPHATLSRNGPAFVDQSVDLLFALGLDHFETGDPGKPPFFFGSFPDALCQLRMRDTMCVRGGWG